MKRLTIFSYAAVVGSTITLSVLLLSPFKLSLNAQQFGVYSTKGHYRSWFLSFSDGQTLDGRSVVIDGEKMRYGYRWIPRYSHCDMRKFFEAHPEIKP